MPKVIFDDSRGLTQQAGQGVDVLHGIVNLATETQPSGAGLISTGAPGKPLVRVVEENGVITTTIKVNLKGFSSSRTVGDVIGLTGAAFAPILQYSLAKHGVLFRTEITCIELPADGGAGTAAPDIDITANASDELVEDGAAGAARVHENGGDHALGKTVEKLAPGAITNDHFLYLTVGADAGASGTYTQGKLIIRLFGQRTF